MGLCAFCKIDSKEQLKSCVCKKVSYCSKDCQTKDWKSHKPACPPYVIRESPGKGRGLFATRKIKEGHTGGVSSYLTRCNSSQRVQDQSLPQH